MKNHESRPTGSAPFPEVNEATHNNSKMRRNHDRENSRGHSRGRGRGHDRGRGRGRKDYWYRGGNKFNHQKMYNDDNKEKGGQANPSKAMEDSCFRCGMNGHWSRTCRTPEHLVKLYQASLKRKEKNVEMNFTSQNDDVEANFSYKDDVFEGLNDKTHLDVEDFFNDKN